ncbi:MAG TPA: glutathione transferase GstA [Hyphomicrobiaceae bacterium]|nr:glutathione transferase GstA [Hyphomicrobiaceae bacterium]
MKLYYTPGVCSLSPHIILKESGLPHSLVKTDIRSKTIDGGADYKSKNPLGYVPALELEDGTLLTEGPAIVQYIADKAPDKNLAPANGTLDRYKMQSWLNFVSTELHKGGFSPLFNPALADDVKKVFRDRLMTRLDHLENHLKKNDYLLGSKFSLPDAYLFTVLRWTVPMKIDLTPYPAIQAYQKRIAARPGVQAAMSAEGLPAA